MECKCLEDISRGWDNVLTCSSCKSEHVENCYKIDEKQLVEGSTVKCYDCMEIEIYKTLDELSLPEEAGMTSQERESVAGIPPRRVIAIEGLIGVGKTTITTALGKQLGMSILTEPVKDWQDSGLLKRFYKEPKENAYELQVTAFESFVAKGYSDQSCAQERSIYSAYYVFTALMYKKGYLTKEQFDRLTNQFRKLIAKTEKLDAIFYIELPTKTALERITERGREGEENITLEYLEELKEMYDTVFVHKNHLFKVPVYKIDGNFSVKQVTQQIIDQLAIRSSKNWKPAKRPKGLGLQWNAANKMWIIGSVENRTKPLHCDYCNKDFNVSVEAIVERAGRIINVTNLCMLCLNDHEVGELVSLRGVTRKIKPSN